MTIDYMKATEKLNALIEDTEYVDMFSFFYTTNGVTEAITLSLFSVGSDILIWQSEDDECSYEYSKHMESKGEEIYGDYSESYFITYAINRISKMARDLTFFNLDLWAEHNK